MGARIKELEDEVSADLSAVNKSTKRLEALFSVLRNFS